MAGLGVDGSVDRAHPAAAQRLEDAVAADPLAGQLVAQRLGSRIRFIHRDARSPPDQGLIAPMESSALSIALAAVI